MPHPPSHKHWARRLVLLTVGLVALGLASAAAVFYFRRPPAGPPGRSRVAEAVRASPFLNVRPEVAYVGDAACAECHASTARSYVQHPMGRSFARLAAGDHPAVAPFLSHGFRFSAEPRPDGAVHRTERLDAQQQPVLTADIPVRYVMGSGTRGKSYLFERDGFLFESPLSWFAQTDSWDLSPGFHAFYPPEPTVDPICLSCHVNRAEVVPHTRNRYRAPIFDGLAIGCERCHGPGAAHVAARRRGDTVEGPIDVSIVNPRHLPPALRENVCQQCHLQGERRLIRYGWGPFDYRPGLPLHEFWAVFVRAEEGGRPKAVSQVEQMYESRCFQASAGRLGCASCHDPHRQPPPEERVEFYRGRCLKCHETKPCALPPPARLAQSPADDCAQCHLPRAATSNIAHTAVSDHRVPRRPAEPAAPGRLPAEEPALVNFFRNDLAPDDDGGRDLGVVLIQLTGSGVPPAGLVAQAQPLLEAAVRAAPDDAEAWDALGVALLRRGREAEALAAWAEALKAAPERDTTLAFVAQTLLGQGKRAEAAAYGRRLVAVSPHNARARLQLSRLLGEQGDWAAALGEVTASVERNPFDTEARQQLVVCLLRTGDRARADAELTILLRLLPGQREKIRAWYAEQAR
jgi:Flp pilus assembly protein TadD